MVKKVAMGVRTPFPLFVQQAYVGLSLPRLSDKTEAALYHAEGHVRPFKAERVRPFERVEELFPRGAVECEGLDGLEPEVVRQPWLDKYVPMGNPH